MINKTIIETLANEESNQIVLDIEGIRRQYTFLQDSLPNTQIRFAIKACPIDEILTALAQKGAGFDAASPNEIIAAIKSGANLQNIHYGNTIKSNEQISLAFKLGIKDFVTDSKEDLDAIAEYAPNSNIFCRIATDGNGAVWSLSKKFGCSINATVEILKLAKNIGLSPVGVSLHIGSQQLQVDAWNKVFSNLAELLKRLAKDNIYPKYINLGGGLPASGYLDKHGKVMHADIKQTLKTIKDGINHLGSLSLRPLQFIIEPGRFMVADFGVIRAHVVRLTTREQLNGEKQHWLYLSVGRYNGLYELDALRFPLLFPTVKSNQYVKAFVAGPTCDSDDILTSENAPISVPANLKAGDPVLILSTGAYTTSCSSVGFNGFLPLPYRCVELETTHCDGTKAERILN